MSRWIIVGKSETYGDTILVGLLSKNYRQQWELDLVGNWGTFKWDPDGQSGWTTQTRTHNKANETQTISDWTNPAYDSRGNITTMPQPANPTSSYTCKYDAWNRLVEVKAGETVVATYKYDVIGRRIQKVVRLRITDPDGNARFVFLAPAK